MTAQTIKGPKLPDTPWRRAAVLVLVVLAHGVGIWVWMEWGGLNTIKPLPPMMVVVEPESKALAVPDVGGIQVPLAKLGPGVARSKDIYGPVAGAQARK